MLGYYRKYKTICNTIKMLKGMQEQNVKDDYSCGLHNGIELCLAAIEEREPEFMTVTKEPKVIEMEEEKQTGRTIASGVRKLSQ